MLAEGRGDGAAAEERYPDRFELACPSLVQAGDRVRRGDDPEVAFARIVDRGTWAIREVEAAEDYGRDLARTKMPL